MTRFLFMVFAVAAMVLVSSSDAQAQCYGGGGYYGGGHSYHGGSHYSTPRLSVSYGNHYAQPHYGGHSRHYGHYPRSYGHYGGGHNHYPSYGHYGHGGGVRYQSGHHGRSGWSFGIRF